MNPSYSHGLGLMASDAENPRILHALSKLIAGMTRQLSLSPEDLGWLFSVLFGTTSLYDPSLGLADFLQEKTHYPELDEYPNDWATGAFHRTGVRPPPLRISVTSSPFNNEDFSSISFIFGDVPVTLTMSRKARAAKTEDVGRFSRQPSREEVVSFTVGGAGWTENSNGLLTTLLIQNFVDNGLELQELVPMLIARRSVDEQISLQDSSESYPLSLGEVLEESRPILSSVPEDFTDRFELLLVEAYLATNSPSVFSVPSEALQTGFEVRNKDGSPISEEALNLLNKNLTNLLSSSSSFDDLALKVKELLGSINEVEVEIVNSKTLQNVSPQAETLALSKKVSKLSPGLTLDLLKFGKEGRPDSSEEKVSDKVDSIVEEILHNL